MSYFTAVLAREGDKWSARDVDVDDVEDLTDLADRLRLIENDDEPVLLLVEREDAWWAVVRVDGDEDPRVFLSDLAAPAHSPYAAFLEVADADAGDEDVSGTCGGDLDLLADLGTSADDLREMCEEEVIPMDAMAAVAEAGGFAEALDSLR
ncbi:MAG TPA: tRNA adenosine deaminase-associated protein [Actinomycetes bacterium]